MKNLLWILLLSLPVWLKTCVGQEYDTTRIPVVETNGQILYLDEIEASIPSGISKEDSSQMAQLLIESWLKETLMYESAKKNLVESAEVKELVEAYRRSLLIYEYQQQALNQKMETSVSEEDISQYYSENSERFLSSQNLIKGLFIKVPLSAPNLKKLKTWYQKDDAPSLENVETYCLQYAVAYDNFYDEWMTLDDVLDQIPYDVKDQEKFLKNNIHLDVEDENYCYLLYMRKYIPAGDPEPLEFVSARIRNILINSQKTTFLHQFEDNMLQEAKEKKEIIYYDVTTLANDSSIVKVE